MTLRNNSFQLVPSAKNKINDLVFTLQIKQNRRELVKISSIADPEYIPSWAECHEVDHTFGGKHRLPGGLGGDSIE